MTNNDRLIIVQKAFKLRANKIAEVCHTSQQTVYTWRKMVGGQYYRNMPDAAWSLLAIHLISSGDFSNMEELDQYIESVHH